MVFIYLFICVSSLSVSASNNTQKVISTKSKLWKDISLLSVEQGISSPSSSGPWSIEELNGMFKRLKRNDLSKSGKIRYDTIQSQLNQNSSESGEGASGNVSLTFNLETYLHANDKFFTSEEDWYVDNEKRKPMALLEGEGWIGSQFYLYSNFGIKNNRFSVASSNIPDTVKPVDTFVFSPIFSNNLLKPRSHDFDTPSRAFIAYGDNNFSIQFGRDLVSWGYGKSGNFIIDNHVKYHEFLKLSLFSKRFKFTNIAMFMEPPGYTTKNRAPYVPESPTDPTLRVLLAHRFEFAPTDSLRIEFSENVMYQDTHFNMKYLNPLFIYHNLSNRSQFNAIADLTVSYTVVPSLALYATWVIDQVQAPGEGGEQPNTMGYQIGLEKLVPRETGTWVIGSEFVFTDPYLYLRDQVDFVVMTREREQLYGYIPHKEFLGYQYGGDAIVFMISAEWHSLKQLSGGVDFFSMWHGDNSIETDFVFGETNQINTPSSPVTRTLRLGIWGEYDFETTPISLSARLDGISRLDTEHNVDIQLVTGISYVF